MHPESEDTAAEIVRLAHKLVGWYSWQVVETGVLVSRILEWLSAGTAPEGPLALERLCERAAAEQLYAALERGELRTASRAEKALLQGAYGDLHNYLLAAARRMTQRLAPDQTAESLVQDTLIAIRAGIKGLAEPEVLLAWAVGIMNRQRLAGWREWRRRSWRSESWDAASDERASDGGIGEQLTEALPHQTEQTIDAAGDKQFYTIISECLRNDQERIVALSLSFGLKRREIMLAFESIAGRFDNVRRSLLARLRDCARVRALFDPESAQPLACFAPGCPVPSLRGTRK